MPAGKILVKDLIADSIFQQIQYVILISAFIIPLWALIKKAGGEGILSYNFV